MATKMGLLSTGLWAWLASKMLRNVDDDGETFSAGDEVARCRCRNSSTNTASRIKSATHRFVVLPHSLAMCCGMHKGKDHENAAGRV